LPAAVTFFWFSAFGGISMQDILMGDTAMIDAVNEDIATASYVFFEKFPLSMVLKILGVVLICSFIITSADSGALVVDSITSGGQLNTPKFQRVIWAVSIGAVASVLMYGGGLNALQTVVTISGLPFAIFLLMMCYSLLTGIREDYEESEKKKEIVEQEEYRKNILDLVRKEQERKTIND